MVEHRRLVEQHWLDCDRWNGDRWGLGRICRPLRRGTAGTFQLKAAVRALGNLNPAEHDARVDSAARSLLLSLLLASALAGGLTSCDDDHTHYCDSGDCVCGVGEDCELACAVPPCTMLCEGDNPHCVAECANGTCECGLHSTCSFECLAPPCHATCGEDSECVGTCANGTCTCSTGAACEFDCAAGPCHVECEGQNPTCDGVCANGTCHCGAGSTCTFACSDANCKVECAAGASCVLECANGGAGQECAFSECSAPMVCADGRAVACHAPCPEPASQN